MTQEPTISLDDVIAAYRQALDAGESPNPTSFVSRWPNHREAFLRSISQIDEVEPLSADATETGSFSDRPMAGVVTPPPIVDGRFKLGRLIGRGGMSRVYEATDLADGSAVAFKVLDSARIPESSLQSRFRREAMAVKSLDHPHIVALLAYASDEAVPYLVFPLIRGCTLGQLVTAFRDQEQSKEELRTQRDQNIDTEFDTSLTNQCGPFEEQETVTATALKCFAASASHRDRYKDLAELIATAADTLHAAHGQGIVHRDVKPSNLMIDLNGHLWLTDFGLASIDDALTLLTHTGQVVGTPHYMSPEQAGGESKVIDRRSDLFSLGATLYELVTLQRPYRGDRMRILLDISSGKLTPPSIVRDDVPKQLEAIILKAMALDPSDRYASAADLSADLRRYAAGIHPLAKTPGFTDHAIRLLVRNPKTSITATMGVAAVAVLVLTLQFVSGQQLSRINSRLSITNTLLEKSNAELEQSNAELDQSRNQFRRYLYIADVAAAYRAYAENDIDRVRQLLVRHTPSEDAASTEDDLRGVEWWLLHNLTRAPEAVEFSGHKGPAREVALVPGSRDIISVGDDGSARRWSLDSQKQLAHFRIGGQLDSIAVSPDGSSFVTGSILSSPSSQLAVRDARTGQTIRPLRRHHHSVESATYSSDGRWIATADRYHNLHLYDSDGNFVAGVPTDSRNETIAFTKDGKQIATIVRQQTDNGHEQFLVSWSVPDLNQVASWKSSNSAQLLTFSGDGRRILVAHPQGFVILNWPDQSQVFEQQDIRGRIRCIAANRNGRRIAAGCDNGMIHLWSLDSNDRPLITRPRTIVSGEARVTSVQFIDDDTLLTTNEAGAVQTWLLSQPDRGLTSFGTSTRSIAAPSEPTDLLFLRNDFGGIDRLQLDNFNDRYQIAHVTKDGEYEMAVTSNGDRLVVGAPGMLVVFSGDDGSEVCRVPTPMNDNESCRSLQFQPDNRLLLALYSDRLLVYETEEWTLQSTTVFAQGGVVGLAQSPDGASTAVVTRNAIHWVETPTMEIQRSYSVKLGEFFHARYTSDGGQIIVGHSDGSIEILDAIDLKRVGLLRGHRGQIRSSVLVNQNRTLVTSSEDGSVRFWDLESGRGVGSIRVTEGFVRNLYFDSVRQRLFGFRVHHPALVWTTGSD